MREGIGQRTIHKLSDFLSNESGRVGAKSALAMGGLVGAAALTQMAFTPEAQAHLVNGCNNVNDCTTFGNFHCCCSVVVDHDNDPDKIHFRCKLRAQCAGGNACVNDNG